jgi:hypothetical protein
MKYLPEKFKDDVKSESARATRRVTEEDPKRREEPKEIVELLTPPHRKGALEIKKYVNTHFVSLILEKSFNGKPPS